MNYKLETYRDVDKPRYNVSISLTDVNKPRYNVSICLTNVDKPRYNVSISLTDVNKPRYNVSICLTDVIKPRYNVSISLRDVSTVRCNLSMFQERPWLTLTCLLCLMMEQVLRRATMGRTQPSVLPRLHRSSRHSPFSCSRKRIPQCFTSKSRPKTTTILLLRLGKLPRR